MNKLSEDVKAEWHILTVTRGGTVSLLKNLTEDVARQTMQRLPSVHDRSGNPWSDFEIWRRVKRLLEVRSAAAKGIMQLGGTSVHTYHVNDGDLERVECFGPEGRQLDVWPKPDDYDARYAAALEKAERELEEAPQ